VCGRLVSEVEHEREQTQGCYGRRSPRRWVGVVALGRDHGWGVTTKRGRG